MRSQNIASLPKPMRSLSAPVTARFIFPLGSTLKHSLRFALVVLLTIFALPSSFAATPLSGTKSVGPGGDYVSITAAIADIQAKPLGGALLLELQPLYVCTVETFPLTFSNLGTTATNTLTLRPQAGAAGLSISSADSTTATVDFNGAQFVTVDGRPGGVGEEKQLTLANTHTSGVALRLINEARGNTFRYLTLRSVNTSATSGTVAFSTTTGAGGNDGNTLDHCDIGDGASTPANGIWFSGTTTTLEQNNSNNTVSNCNIFNFYATETDAAGVLLEAGSTDWTISGSSFYQTAIRSTVDFHVYGIFVNNAAQTGGNFIISGNFIGGSAPGAGGTPWTTSDTGASYFFEAIHLTCSSSVPSSVQGNSVANMAWNTFSIEGAAPGAWAGIYVQAGAANIGTVTGNAIGSGAFSDTGGDSGTGSISYTSSDDGSVVYGICSTSSDTVVIASNRVGSITANAKGTYSASILGIQVTAGTNTITGNIVGSPTIPNSLNAATAAISPSITQQVVGIIASVGSSSAIITGNTVANLNNNHIGVGNSARTCGILATSGVNTITGNTVRNLSTTSRTTSSDLVSSVLGIGLSSASAGQTVSHNVVHSLANTATQGDVRVTGILFINGTAGSSDVVSYNLVHSLAIASSSSFSKLTGMVLSGGTLTTQNNLVRVGLDASGASTAQAGSVTGLIDSSTSPKLYHNSVYVGGMQTSGSASLTSSFAFHSPRQNNVRDYRNNIFCNARSNGSASAKHYAVNYSGNTAHPTGLTAGNNLLYAPNTSTGSVLGSYNFNNIATQVEFTTLSALQAALGVEAHSLSADPLFVNAAGTAAMLDLSPQGLSPAIGAAAPGTGVTDDFYGHARSTTAPTIGAVEVISTNAGLAGLTLSTGTLAPSFASTVTSYSTTVLRPASSVTVTPTTSNSTASVQVSTNGGGYTSVSSGSASDSQALNLGSNTLNVLVTAQDGTTTQTYTVSVTRCTFLQGWRSQYFSSISNAGDAADTATPRNDGVTNLMKFATGLDPALSTPQPGGVVKNSGNLEFTYPRSIDAMAECTFTVEWSDTLLAGSWSSTGVTERILSATSTLQQVRATLPDGGSNGRFVRLRVTTP